MGTEQTLEKLLTDAKTPGNEIAVRDLLEFLDKVGPQTLKDSSERFETLCETWEEGVTRSDDKAELCVRLAELSVLDTPVFRALLHAAVRKLLPPYLSSPSVVRAIGAKDPAVGTREAALRLRKLQHLRSTALVYQQNSCRWGKINGIDRVTGTIAITSLSGGSVSSVPIASAILSLHFFETTPEMMNLLLPRKNACRPSAEYRKAFLKNSLSEIHEEKICDIVRRLMVPDIMPLELFDAWWKADQMQAGGGVQTRPFWKARSVLELHSILNPDAAGNAPELSGEASESLKNLFTRVRSNLPPKDALLLAECISALARSNAGAETLRGMFRPLRGKAPFWPEEIREDSPLQTLETWGRLSVKFLCGLVKASSLLYTPEELVLLGALLPLKCIGPLFSTLPESVVQTAIPARKSLSCDLMLWIFRNRNSLPEKIASSVDMAHVISGLSVEKLPKEWGAAQRELKKDLFDKADFQKYLLENADGDIPSLVAALRKHRSFQAGECQSLLVKLSRHSEELKDFLESGGGNKLTGLSMKAEAEQPPVTSLASHKRMTDELENLVSVLIPENAAAVALARSYGDLRENAEYDAAKERRRYLHRRRSELERILNFINPTDFKDVRVKDQAVIGSVVTLASSADGKEKKIYLLGAWDGDPEKDFVSYKTRIGEALLDKKTGDTVEIPGSGACVIQAVEALPEKIRKELACEQ